MRKFKVLLVVPLSGIGGTELSTLTLATGLKQAGHQVYVLCNAHPLVDKFTERGLNVVPAGMQRSLRGLIKGASEMRHCIVENKIEIIHFQSAFPIVMSLLSWRGIKANKVKVVWTCRGIKRISYPVVGRLFNSLTDFVIANCNAERDRLIRHGLSPQKVTTVYNCPTIPIPEDTGKNEELLRELGIGLDTPVVGTASRLAPERGVKYFIEAAAMISQQVPGVKFIIAGGGPLEKELQQQASKLNIEGQVVFLGPRHDMERVYSIMDILVNPALIRCGIDNINAEAMAFAKPVIATDIGGAPEIVQDGITGILVPERDAEKLAQAALLLLKDKDSARQMGMAGRKLIESRFSRERLIEEVEKVYASCISEPNRIG